MKNLKKLVAGLSVAAVAMSFGTAFAATPSASYEAKSDTDTTKVIKLTDLALDNTQWTVVVIDAAKKDSSLKAEDLYYINQGSNGDTFWTNGLGTKTELTVGGQYIVRIGGENCQNVIEIPLTVSSGESSDPEYLLGDITGDDWVGSEDALEVLYFELNQESEHIPVTATPGDIYYKIADITKDDWIGSEDALEMLYYELNMEWSQEY